MPAEYAASDHTVSATAAAAASYFHDRLNHELLAKAAEACQAEAAALADPGASQARAAEVAAAFKQDLDTRDLETLVYDVARQAPRDRTTTRRAQVSACFEAACTSLAPHFIHVMWGTESCQKVAGLLVRAHAVILLNALLHECGMLLEQAPPAPGRAADSTDGDAGFDRDMQSTDSDSEEDADEESARLSNVTGFLLGGRANGFVEPVSNLYLKLNLDRSAFSSLLVGGGASGVVVTSVLGFVIEDAIVGTAAGAAAGPIGAIVGASVGALVMTSSVAWFTLRHPAKVCRGLFSSKKKVANQSAKCLEEQLCSRLRGEQRALDAVVDGFNPGNRNDIDNSMNAISALLFNDQEGRDSPIREAVRRDASAQRKADARLGFNIGRMVHEAVRHGRCMDIHSGRAGSHAQKLFRGLELVARFVQP